MSGGRDTANDAADGPRRAGGHGPTSESRTTRDRPRSFSELVLAGFLDDQDELLGDLTEERAHREATHGPRSARRWYRRQAVLALPHLLGHGLRTRPGRVALGVAGAWAVNLAVLASLGPTGSFDSRYSPTAGDVLRDTVIHGVVILLGGLLAGAVAALLSRGARLVPVVLVAAFCSLWAWEGPFYAVYGPGRPTSDGFEIAFGAWSPDLVVPALWQLPTMSVLMPTVTVLGGILAVARTRRRGPAPGSALARPGA